MTRMPLGNPRQHSPAAMLNILGDVVPERCGGRCRHAAVGHGRGDADRAPAPVRQGRRARRPQDGPRELHGRNARRSRCRGHRARSCCACRSTETPADVHRSPERRDGCSDRRGRRVARRGPARRVSDRNRLRAGGDAANPEAVARIYAAKGRPANHPVIVHLPPGGDPGYWADDLPADAQALIDAFWPGLLTLILKRHARIPDAVSGGQDSVGLRCPSHPVAQALLAAFSAARRAWRRGCAVREPVWPCEPDHRAARTRRIRRHRARARRRRIGSRYRIDDSGPVARLPGAAAPGPRDAAADRRRARPRTATAGRQRRDRAARVGHAGRRTTRRARRSRCCRSTRSSRCSRPRRPTASVSRSSHAHRARDAGRRPTACISSRRRKIRRRMRATCTGCCVRSTARRWRGFSSRAARDRRMDRGQRSPRPRGRRAFEARD